MLTIQADRSARNAAAGFLLAGMLMGVLGSLLVAWRYQLDHDPRSIGVHFLALSAAVLLAGVLTQLLLRRVSIKSVCLWSCTLACAAFVELTVAAPPMLAAWRILGLFLAGASAGALLTALLHFVRPYYEDNAAATLNFCGLMFGLGSLLVTLTVGGLLVYPVQWETLLLAAVPVGFLIWLSSKARLQAGAPPKPVTRHRLNWGFKDLRNVAAVLFSLLLFFQFGNEWALAGWLPLFLIHRLGVSPESAIFVLALYFLALITGRLIVQLILPYSSHAKLLFGSVLVAMFGYLLLSLTQSTFGAGLATVITGLAFAPIYALVAENMGHRFDYEPGFFNGIFSLAVTGGMLMPSVLGFVGYYVGMSYLLIVPAFGSVAVLGLMLLIMLESRLMSARSQQPHEPRSDSKKAIPTAAGHRQ